MRILIHDFGAYPFSAQLARTLASRGHEVAYLFRSGFRSPRGDVERRPTDPPMLEFHGIGVGAPFRGRAGMGRLLQERRYGANLAATITHHRPEVVVSANCPLDAQALALAAAHRADAAFVFWLQDIYSRAVGQLLSRAIPLLGSVVGARFARLERRLLRQSEAVVIITEDFLPAMREWVIPEDRITAIENWAPLDEIVPRPKLNPWSAAHGFADTPVLLYAGTLGRKHEPRRLLDLADAIPDAQVVIVSEGVGTDRLRAGTLPANVSAVPLQPASHLSDVLGTSDVLVALLAPDARNFSVPSKVLTYLAAGRPILAAMAKTNAASRAITQAAAGIVVDPDDADGFVAAAKSLLDDAPTRSRLGANARRYAEESFQIDTKADRFERVLSAAIHRRSSLARPDASEVGDDQSGSQET